MAVSAEQSRARLYQALAEALAEPSGWLSSSGYQWPLFASALEVADQEGQAAIRQVLPDLAAIPPESLGVRRERYGELFCGAGRPRLWLYESLARDGQLAGPRTLSLWTLYQAAGLAVAESELPDHASVELAFLAYLCEQEIGKPTEAAQWRRARRLFVKQHVGQWLPALGQALAHTRDPVYGPVGRLLVAVLNGEIHPRRTASRAARGLPTLLQPESCNLCSFCVQVCPTHALAIRETDEITKLVLADSGCIACGRCVRACMTNALQLSAAAPYRGQRVLRQSPRAHCPSCGQPTVSQAELQEVAARIGAPAWLDYCLDCRLLVLEKVP